MSRFSRVTYQMVADVLSDGIAAVRQDVEHEAFGNQEDVIEYLAGRFAQVFEADNDRFKADIFRTAVMLDMSHKTDN